MALALNDSYVKAYLRRGVARACLGRREDAREGESGGAWVGEDGVWPGEEGRGQGLSGEEGGSQGG